jgi:uncharacterized protein (DUF1778 family)
MANLEEEMIQVATRLTPAEAKMVRAAAGLQGESISQFMRPLVLNAATELLQRTALAMVQATQDGKWTAA